MRLFKAPPLSDGAKIEIENSKRWLEATEGPLFVEVGCGVGFHPLAFIREHPSKRMIAFERTLEKFEKAARRLETHRARSPQYQNCLIVHADASHLWEHLFDQSSIDGLFFLYPNPYPKSQQANLRLAAMPFFTTALESLKPNAVFVFATNEKFYFDELLANMQARNEFKIEMAGPVPNDIQPRSHFEKKYLERGETCYQILATKLT